MSKLSTYNDTTIYIYVIHKEYPSFKGASGMCPILLYYYQCREYCHSLAWISLLLLFLHSRNILIIGVWSTKQQWLLAANCTWLLCMHTFVGLLWLFDRNNSFLPVTVLWYASHSDHTDNGATSSKTMRTRINVVSRCFVVALHLWHDLHHMK